MQNDFLSQSLLKGRLGVYDKPIYDTNKNKKEKGKLI